MNPEDIAAIKANVQRLIDKGAPDQDIHDYLEASGFPQQHHAQPKIGQMGHAITEDASPEEPSYAQQALGGVASLAKDIPGAEAAQAGARALVRRQPYSEALSDIRGAEDAAPAAVRWGNRIAGGTIAAAAMPGSNVIKQGAAFGGLTGFLKADPASLGERGENAAKEAAVGAIAGRVAQGIGVAGRGMKAQTLGRVAQLRKAVMEAADKEGYGRAAREGDISAANPTPQAVSDVMDESDVKPYVKEVQNSRTLQGANSAATLRETYKLMTERQRMLARQAMNSGDYKAGTELERADIGAAKKQVLSATDNIMPSFRGAVYRHAELSRQRQAFRAAADATNRIIKGNVGSASRLEQNSPEAFMQSIDAMSPEEAKAALQGALGRIKASKTALSTNPLKMFGAPHAALRYNDLIPVIDALDKKAGNNFSSFSRALGIGTGTSAMQ